MLRFEFRSQRTVAANFLVALLLVVASAGYSFASGRNILWQSRDQFVALEGQGDSAGRKAAPNSHPFAVSRERLEAMLSSLEVRPSPGEPIGPLFTKESLDVLVPEVQSALQQAGPGEDVTFAVIGLYRAFMGLAKSPKVTTGRIFVEHGKVNVIFGLVQQDFKEREDRRLSPFTPGERAGALPGEWKILPKTGQKLEIVRKDWVVFDEGWQAPVEPVATSVPVVAAPVSVPPRTNRANDDRRSPAERLIILNELKSKGLISEDEYRTKRLGILNEL